MNTTLLAINEINNLYDVINYVLENEYHHFLESIDYDVTDIKSENEMIQQALNDSEYQHHSYAKAYHAKKFLDSLDNIK